MSWMIWVLLALFVLPLPWEICCLIALRYLDGSGRAPRWVYQGPGFWMPFRAVRDGWTSWGRSAPGEGR